MNKSSIVFLLSTILATFLYLIGLAFYLTDHEPGDKCEMTYMFEYPQYVRIHQQIDETYTKYGLYAYAEGRTTKKARNMHFDGIPVLFIPGNAGSYQQVRSLASVALRKYLNKGLPHHFDYFSTDLNGEFSALYGPVLYDQLNYVLASIDTILSLYPNRDHVILIGHSMGGIVAQRATATLQKSGKNIVNILINLASPLVRGPIYFDKIGSDFYAFSQPQIVFSVSIAGGYSDILVPSYLTTNNTISLSQTQVPKCWVESNHVQILWCKQLVLAINRALFDGVKANGQMHDKQVLERIFKHHLVHNSGTKNLQKLVSIDYKGEWIESIYKQYTVDLKRGLKHTHWYMMGVSGQPGYEYLTVMAVNLEVTDWVFACNAAYPNKAQRVCIEAENLTPNSEIFPTNSLKRRLITVNMHQLKKTNQYSHVVFRALPTSEHITFHVDTYGAYEREIKVPLTMSLNKEVVVDQTAQKSLRYDLIFPELVSPLQIYQLYVDNIGCSSEQHHATASLMVPWASESVHAHFTESLNKPLSLRLQHEKPLTNDSARVRLILDPACTYRIAIKWHFIGVFGQIARYFSTFFLSSLTVVFLLAFQRQLLCWGDAGVFPIFFTALFGGLKQSWLLIMAYLATLMINIPPAEFQIFAGFGTILAMLLLFLVSFIVVLILAVSYSVSLFTLESTVHKLTLKLLARSVTLTVKFSDYLMNFLQKVPLLVSAALVLLSVSTCGGLALCVGMVFYFLKLTQMSQDYVEEVAWFIVKQFAKQIKATLFKRKQKNETKPLAIDEKPDLDQKEPLEEASAQTLTGQTIKEEERESETKKPQPFKDLTKRNNSIFFHSSVFFLWTIVTMLNIPAVLTWAHNFRFSKHLAHDVSLIPGLVFSLGGFVLWQFDLPRSDRRWVPVLRYTSLILVSYIFLYACVSVYRINFLLTLLFAMVVMQQLSACKERGDEEEKGEDKVDEMKLKMD